MISIVSSAQIINVQTLEKGVTIEYPKFFTYKQGEDLNIRFHTFNTTDGKLLTNETTNCTFNLYNRSGEKFI